MCVRADMLSRSRVQLLDPMDCSPPGSSVHGVLQARILEWVAIPFFFPALGSNLRLLHCKQFFTTESTGKALYIYLYTSVYMFIYNKQVNYMTKSTR